MRSVIGMPAIFISYRRHDSVGNARNLHYRLAAEYGKGALFFDRNDIHGGSDFPDEIARALDAAKVLLALIGPGWLEAKDEDGRRRVDDPKDYVRREIARALERGIKVIPVLLENASFPSAAALPGLLRPFCDKNAHHQRGNTDEFDLQFQKLVELLDAEDGIPAKIPKRAVLLELENGRIADGPAGDKAAGFPGLPVRRLGIPWRNTNVRDNVDALLNWRSGLTDLEGREGELRRLHAWATSGHPLGVLAITGEGGVGKTRLAFQFAQQLRDLGGWEAGQWNNPDKPRAFFAGEHGTLLVIDYPEENQAALQELPNTLNAMVEPSVALRILLLTRNPRYAQSVSEAAGIHAEPPLALAPLPPTRKDGWRLFSTGWRRLRDIKRLSVQEPPLDEKAFRDWQQAHPLNERPLFIIAQALNLIEQPGATRLQGPDVVKSLVNREHRHLKEEARKRGLHPLALVLPQALAAIAKGLTARQIHALSQQPGFENLLPDYDTLRETTVWRKNADGSEALPGLELDILAACLLAQVMDRGDDGPGAWLYAVLALAEDPEITTSRLGRLIHDATVTLGLHWPLDGLVQAVSGDAEHCRSLDAGLSRDYLERTLIPLAIAVSRTLAESTDEPEDQAGHLNNLSIRLAESGERAEGLAAIRRAVAIREQLAEGNFAAYGPDLAQSLAVLSMRQREAGEDEEARASLERARAAVEPFAVEGTPNADILNWIQKLLEQLGSKQQD